MMRRPGAGFVIFCTTYGVLAGYLAWGFSEPAADTLNMLSHAIQTGQKTRLQDADLLALHQALARHPQQLGSLLTQPSAQQGHILSPHRQGWIHGTEALVFHTGHDSLKISLKPSFGSEPVQVQIQGFNGHSPGWNWQRSDSLAAGNAKHLSFPSSPHGELLQLRFAQTVDAHLQWVAEP